MIKMSLYRLLSTYAKFDMKVQIDDPHFDPPGNRVREFGKV